MSDSTPHAEPPEPTGPPDPTGPAGPNAENGSNGDLPVLRRRSLQFRLRSLFLLALIAAGLFWALSILANSGQDEQRSAYYVKLVFAAAGLSVASIPVVLFSYVLFYAILRPFTSLASTSAAGDPPISATTQGNDTRSDPVPASLVDTEKEPT